MIFRCLALAVFVALAGRAVVAAPYLYSGDHYRTDFETQETFLSDNVRVEYLDRVFFADKAVLNGKTQILNADGNVKVTKGEVVIVAKRATINLNTGFGSFYDAVLRSGSNLYLEGKEINFYEKDRYRILQGKVSRCQDCPQAWSVTGAYMDMEIEGFLEAHHALIQVKDVPVLYLPVYFLPLKTKRQSGFLMPKYSHFAELGSAVSVPYYRVLSNSADTTLEYMYTERSDHGAGHRFGNEFIYNYSDRTYFESYQSYLLRRTSQTFLSTLPTTNRWGGVVSERWQLNSGVVQRFRSEYSSDPRYSYQFDSDFPSSRLPTLDTETSLSRQTSNTFLFGLARWHEDNLVRRRDILLNPELTDQKGEIQELPEVGFSLASFPIIGALRSSVDLHYVNFHRWGGEVDRERDLYLRDRNAELQQGITTAPMNGSWIRTGQRSTANLRFIAPTDVSVFQWKPIVDIRGDVYGFSSPGIPASAFRVRYLIDQTFGTTFSRVWSTDFGDMRALKHTIEPYVRWSYSDRDLLSDHPFFEQGYPKNNRARAPQFDLFDPYSAGDDNSGKLDTADEEQRLRANHIFTFALASRLIARYGEDSRRYETLLGGTVLQDVDFYRRDPVTGQPTLGLFRLEVNGGYGGFGLQTALALDWKTKNSDFGNNLSYSWSYYRVGMNQRVAGETRYYGVSGGLSNMGPWSASGEYTFNDRRKLHLEPQHIQKYRIDYSGSDSLCWFFNVAFVKDAADDHFNFLPQIGFVIDEKGKKASMDSLSKKRAAR